MKDSPLRYLSSADVLAALPDIEEQLRLAERVMLGLVEGAQLPAKIGVQPAPAGSFAHAMPSLLSGRAADGSDDLLGVKWVVGFPANVAAGLPAVHGTAILSDGATGLPRAVVDAGVLTAQRTAAVSGSALGRWGPQPGSSPRVALVGAGAQARSHLPVIRHVLGDATVILCDQEPRRAEALASEAGMVGRVEIVRDANQAAADADVVLTMVSFGPVRQMMAVEAFARSRLVIAVDYDMCVPAAVAQRADLFLVDHREQYLANRTSTAFVGYPEDPAMIGEAMRSTASPPTGRVLVTHLGVGLADVVFADAVLRVAEARGIGTLLPR
jgi:ornithine cyclodeaminase/alanine dehydrogenase-like protein (mu-crystallin family)